MSSNTDKEPSDSPEPPEDLSRDELEEALNWLENLAARQGTNLEGLTPLDSDAGDESPFRGLFESDEGELPDWLRELPSDPDKDLYTDRASHMDWLARMASEESVEELPTLQWRQLSNNADDIKTDEDSQPQSDDDLADLFDEPSPSQTTSLTIVSAEAGSEETDDATSEKRLDEAIDSEPTTSVEESDINLLPPVPLVEADLADATINEAESVDRPELELPGESGIENTATEALVDPVVHPEPDDLDAAMAWLEELAASTDAPIEDLPSVADRALASKLMAEATSSEPAEVATPSVEPGDLPDSGVLEDEIREAAIEPENEVNPEPVESEPEHDDIEVAQGVTLVGAIAYEAATPVEVTTDSIAASPKPAVAAEPTTDDLLAELDELAVPAGRSLETVATRLATLPVGFLVSPYSLESTLDWLTAERTAPRGTTELLDPDLVAAMPEDPDEALQWLESMAEPDLVPEAEWDSGPLREQSSTPVDVTEADLLDMPDDPDEAMAWIESLASKGSKKQ